MTDDYKLDLLNYIVGNVTPTQPTNEEIFKEQEDIIRDEWIPFLPNGWQKFHFEGMISPNETTTSLGVLYGGYVEYGTTTVRGIIILFDQDFKPVKTIYQYDSGTYLRYIQEMNQAEDGTFYFIDDIAYSYNENQQVRTSQKRFVMVNNFTLKNSNNDYLIHLRISYIWGSHYQNFYCRDMYKDPNSSHYIFFGSGADNTSYQYSWVRTVELKINVGMPNEWELVTNISDNIYGCAFAVFEGENVKFRILSSYNALANRDIFCTEKTYTGSPTTSSIATFNYLPYIDTNLQEKQSVFLSYDEVYFVQNNQQHGVEGSPNDKYIGLYKYNFTNSSLTTIYEKSLGSYAYSQIEFIYIDRCDVDLYIQFIDNINDGKADYYFQRFTGEWKPIKIAEQKTFNFRYRTMFVKSNFNLLQVYMYATTPSSSYWFQYLIKEDYNVLNYNGEEYTNYDSMLSKKGELYSDGKLVFARNLYNRTQYQNTTTSTIQVSNNYLNDIPLDVKTLISNTNTIMVNDTNSITKNVYEALLLNYVNTINVIDQDTNTLYPLTANYINTNVHTGTKVNMEDTCISKVRLNFATTPLTQPITWTDTTEGKETKFTIYVSEELDSIDFISDDGTVYISKNYNLEVGKMYTISQKIKIGG